MRSLLQSSRSALRLDARARAQAVRALGWLAVTRIALAVLPFAQVQRAISTLEPRGSCVAPVTSAECARAVGRAARLMIGSRCLARALAAECLLRREGRHVRLTVGVHLDEQGQLRAHAWLESDGTVVTGGEERAGYSPLRRTRLS